ncbi:MAG: hypothetical protein IJ085_00475 [Turicibacter sp.]|nr:hypothetical protein [Turicibacter sp.]
MKLKLKLLLLIMVFLAGCQWLGQRREISYPQPVINVSIQEEKITEIDANQTETIEIDSESKIVNCPVDPKINLAVELFKLQMSEKQLAAIIHEPSTEQLNVLNQLDVVEYYQNSNDERILIIPKNIGSKISIYEVTYQDDELIETKILLESQFIEDKQVFDLKCVVPEGIPQMKIVIEYKENRVEYLMTYDGMGTRPQIEYLEYKD